MDLICVGQFCIVLLSEEERVREKWIERCSAMNLIDLFIGKRNAERIWECLYVVDVLNTYDWEDVG